MCSPTCLEFLFKKIRCHNKSNKSVWWQAIRNIALPFGVMTFWRTAIALNSLMSRKKGETFEFCLSIILIPLSEISRTVVCGLGDTDDCRIFLTAWSQLLKTFLLHHWCRKNLYRKFLRASVIFASKSKNQGILTFW